MQQEEEPKLVTLNIFGKKYQVSKQARMVFYTYLVSFIAGVLIMITSKNMMLNSIVMLLFTLIVLVIGTYATNCLVVGKCSTYAWVIVGFAFVNAFIYVLSALTILYYRIFTAGGIKDHSMPARRSSIKRSKK
jgi:hypothetical protein